MRQNDRIPERIDLAAPIFAALGDATRLGIVQRLAAQGTASISELRSTTEVSRQAVSKHLQVLESAGLVRGERRGRQHVYELEPESLAEAKAWIRRIEAQGDAPRERSFPIGGELPTDSSATAAPRRGVPRSIRSLRKWR